MSAILISFTHERRVAIDDAALSHNNFRAEFLLNPDGDYDLSREYGYLRLTVTGDSSKIPDKPLSELEEWLPAAVARMIASKPGGDA